ncbi:metal-sensing transcriptional repressor [Eggerthellaceae bacterium zg-1084]|uniref:metal-sensing transcriptional repressor n=1 Tax=Berryella wangjianweii TaxID=2734634 RepID=UPI001557657E|nr:metal-sensing transcriptional repressor [Berryella wangjianweii]NPD31408.1 metal-sensing transcriptional repressor [Berryella wangjianweii]
MDGGSSPDRAPTSAEAGGCACARHKATPRSEELQADLTRRLNRAIGQLGGVKAMLDDNRYCGDVLIQLAAVQSAIRSVSERLLQNHLETCVVEQIQQGNTAVVEEVLSLIRRHQRS